MDGVEFFRQVCRVDLDGRGVDLRQSAAHECQPGAQTDYFLLQVRDWSAFVARYPEPLSIGCNCNLTFVQNDDV